MKKLLLFSLSLNILAAAYWIAKRVYYSRKVEIIASDYTTTKTYAGLVQLLDTYEYHKSLMVITGDSHADLCDWNALLQRFVINQGISGDRAHTLYKRIGQVIKAAPRVCYISIGINAIRLHKTDSVFYYCKRIADTLEYHNIEPVFLKVTKVASHYPDAAYINSQVDTLNKRLFSLITLDAGIDTTDLQADGIHYAPIGYEKLRRAILATPPFVY